MLLSLWNSFAFFAGFFYNNEIKDEDPNNLRFTIIFASSKSIDRLKTDNLLSIDATYRLNWMGYPVFVAGMYL